PVLMRCQRLLKARALLRRLAVALGQKSCLPQYAPDAGRTHRHDVCVEHHERQPAVALQPVLQMKADDGLLLPILQPEVAGTVGWSPTSSHNFEMASFSSKCCLRMATF